MGRMHPQLIVDVSFTIMRYAGSSIDRDLRFLAEQLDQRMSVGSDFPEYTPAETLARFDALTAALVGGHNQRTRPTLLPLPLGATPGAGRAQRR